MFQKYKYVLAVHQERSFTNAAKKLFISQPSLSVAIRNIEKQIGGPLFERSGLGVKPTVIGDAYIASARKMYLAEDEFEKKCADIHGLQTGKLVVGGSNCLCTGMLPQIITRFRDRFPNVEITLVEANSIRLREMLHNEEVDMVIDNFEEGSDQWEKYPLTNEQVLLCLPGDRPINRELVQFQILPERIFGDAAAAENIRPVDLSLFQDEKFVLLKSGNDMHARAMAMFGDRGMIPNVTFPVDQLNISYALTESGLGACFVTDTLFKYRKHTGNVVLYKPDAPQASRILYAAYKKNRYCTKAMSKFITIAREIITP